MEEKKTIQVDPQVLANIHNALMNTHPTGADIITIASVCMDIRRMLEEGAAKQVETEREEKEENVEQS